jgi:SAM-dependent methyltransferase
MSQAACPGCGQDASEPCEFIDVAEQHKLYAPGNPEMQQGLTAAATETASSYQMLKCLHCGLEFCDPLVAPSAAWYQLTYRALDLYSSDRWEFHEVLRHVPKGSDVFEFGCGSGSFLMHCRNHGVSASGMDFSEDGVNSCRAKGLAARQLDLNEDAHVSDKDRFPQMAAFHFLEHLDRPATLFKQAASRALPSAHLWVSVPSDRRSTRRFGVTDFLDQPPHHVTRWTPEAFREIGKQQGWRLVETIYEPMTIRTALWCISVNFPSYRKWKAEGRFRHSFVEQAYRAFALPAALIQRLTSERHLTDFAMLAHFVFDIH